MSAQRTQIGNFKRRALISKKQWKILHKPSIQRLKNENIFLYPVKLAKPKMINLSNAAKSHLCIWTLLAMLRRIICLV